MDVGEKYHLKASGVEYSVEEKNDCSQTVIIKYRGRNIKTEVATKELIPLSAEGWNML